MYELAKSYSNRFILIGVVAFLFVIISIITERPEPNPVVYLVFATTGFFHLLAGFMIRKKMNQKLKEQSQNESHIPELDAAIRRSRLFTWGALLIIFILILSDIHFANDFIIILAAGMLITLFVQVRAINKFLKS